MKRTMGGGGKQAGDGETRIARIARIAQIGTRVGTAGAHAAARQRAAGPVKRPPLERMHRIFGWLRDGEYPNCARITAEFDVDRKTAWRDVGFMQDRMGLPIAYDDKQHGYYFTRPVAGFPGVPVTEQELFGICVVHKAIEHYHGTPLQQPLEMLFQKVTGQLDDKEWFTLQNLDEALSFRPFAPEDADLRLARPRF